MRIMIWIGHPKQVHFWKNIVRNLSNNGHEVKLLATEKDNTSYLLNAYGLEYDLVGKNYRGLLNKSYGLIQNDFKSLKIAQKFMPDILIAGISLAHVSKYIGKPFMCFTDTEHANLAHKLLFPFSDVICTPSCYKGKIDTKKHLKFNGYEELAYLHPNYFKPDPNVLDEIGLTKNDKFIILRFVSWNASHDIGHHGIDSGAINKYISKLEQYGQVFISSESKMPKCFESYQLKISPENIHSLLSFAQLYFGESGAMTTEAALLGTPSIYVSSLVGTMGNFIELEKKYGLTYSFTDADNAIQKALELMEEKNIKNKWKNKRDKLLSEKIDVTKFLAEFIENYPNSFAKYKGYQ